MTDTSLALLILGSVLLLLARRKSEEQIPPPSALLGQARTILSRLAPYQGIINELARFYGLDPNLVMAVIWRESGGDPNAVGDDGKSFGLMQVTLDAAKDVGFWPITAEILLIPQDNIETGAAYLAHLRRTYDLTWEQTVAAYNWGIGNVSKAKARGVGLSRYPRKVQNYVAAVLAYWEALRAVTVV